LTKQVFSGTIESLIPYREKEKTMCNKQNLPNRVEKAKAAEKFAKILEFDERGRVKTVQVPGTEGKTYIVRFTRENGQLEATCENATGVIHRQCISHAKVPCYHVMAAVQVAARHSGRKVMWCANYPDAKNLNNIYHSDLYTVAMIPTGSAMYGVAYQ
jgi:hypothetical protein